MNKRYYIIGLFLIVSLFTIPSIGSAESIHTVHYVNTVESTVIQDSDGDQLSDQAELLIGTDPLDPDTDNDGFIDGLEVNPNTNIGKHADPLRKDIFIEVTKSKTNSTEIRAELTPLIEMFNTSPVQNPSTEEAGISVHVRSNTIQKSQLDNETPISYSEYSSLYFDEDINTNRNRGFYHVLLSDGITSDSNPNVIGITRPSKTTTLYQNLPSFDGMLVSTDSERVGQTIAHELGHQLGLRTEVYSGIDSTKKEWSEYPSVMNYNEKQKCFLFSCQKDFVYKFSEDKGYDDWEYIEENIETNQAEYNQSRTEKMRIYTVFDMIQEG